MTVGTTSLCPKVISVGMLLNPSQVVAAPIMSLATLAIVMNLK
jgi:predicted Kef-type K+ transport protein